MEFTWNMTETNWKNLMNDNTQRDCESLSKDFDFYGNCYIGHLCADIQHTGDESAWYAFVNVFALGIDDGYAYTKNGDIPYSLLDFDFEVPVNCMTFESFKAEFEKNFTAFIESKTEYNELANMPLGNWD